MLLLSIDEESSAYKLAWRGPSTGSIEKREFDVLGATVFCLSRECFLWSYSSIEKYELSDNEKGEIEKRDVLLVEEDIGGILTVF